MYCENCFKEELEWSLKEYYEDSLGSIFCNKECYLNGVEYREKEILKQRLSYINALNK